MWVISSFKTTAGELGGCLESVVKYCLKDDKASLDVLYFFFATAKYRVTWMTCCLKFVTASPWSFLGG